MSETPQDPNSIVSPATPSSGVGMSEMLRAAAEHLTSNHATEAPCYETDLTEAPTDEHDYVEVPSGVVRVSATPERIEATVPAVERLPRFGGKTLVGITTLMLSGAGAAMALSAGHKSPTSEAVVTRTTTTPIIERIVTVQSVPTPETKKLTVPAHVLKKHHQTKPSAPEHNSPTTDHAVAASHDTGSVQYGAAPTPRKPVVQPVTSENATAPSTHQTAPTKQPATPVSPHKTKVTANAGGFAFGTKPHTSEAQTGGVSGSSVQGS